jgi:hypothetical protein
VVYGYILAHVFYSPEAVPFYALAPIVFVCALGASLSRIFVGAHYASDCLAGLVLGVLFCAIGSLLNRAVDAGCASCVVESSAADSGREHCYAATPEQRLTFHNLSSLNLGSLFVVAGGAVVSVGAAMSSPLLFWQKCLPIFGLGTPVLAFRLVLLCPQHNSAGVALFRMALPPPAWMVVVALSITAGALLLGKVVNKLITARESVAAQLATAEVELMADQASSSPSHSQLHHSQSHSLDGGSSSMMGEHDDSVLPLDASQRLLLQCSSFKSTLVNLTLFLFVFSGIFVSLAAWRIAEATPAK